MGISTERADEIIRQYADRMMKAIIFPGCNTPDYLMEVGADESLNTNEKLFLVYHYANKEVWFKREIMSKLSAALDRANKDDE